MLLSEFPEPALLIGLADHWPDVQSLITFVSNQAYGTFEMLLSSSAGILLMGGMGASLSASIGVTGYVGYMG